MFYGGTLDLEVLKIEINIIILGERQMSIFSIIVPVYNVENELGKCIDSILAQSIEDFELILIDDGSTDNSGKICDAYEKKDKRIKVIHKINGGVSSARNSGLDIANGDCITFIDSDDYVDYGYLKKLYNPNVDMVLCNMKYMQSYKNNYRILDNEIYGVFKIDEEIINKIIESKYINSACSKMYKNNLIQKNNIRFKENISLGEDTIFVIDYINNIKNLEVKKDVIYTYISYDRDTLSVFNEKSIRYLEYLDEYIKNNLLRNRSIQPGKVFDKRRWDKYEWAIFKTISSEKMSFMEKRRILKSVFKNENYIELVKGIDNFMPNDTKIVREILATRSVNLVMLFFFICNLKSRIRIKNEL